MDYYSKLVDNLPASELSHYFVSHNVITLTDHDSIVRSSSPQDAAKVLLSRVLFQIRSGNLLVLNDMLLIIEHYGTVAIKALSLEMRNKLSNVKGSYMVENYGQGKYRIIKCIRRHTEYVPVTYCAML